MGNSQDRSKNEVIWPIFKRDKCIFMRNHVFELFHFLDQEFWCSDILERGCNGLSVPGHMFRLLSLEGGTGQFKWLANVQLFKIFPGTQPETLPACRASMRSIIHIFLAKHAAWHHVYAWDKTTIQYSVVHLVYIFNDFDQTPKHRHQQIRLATNMQGLISMVNQTSDAIFSIGWPPRIFSIFTWREIDNFMHFYQMKFTEITNVFLHQ
jgi:hypothetical protein